MSEKVIDAEVIDAEVNDNEIKFKVLENIIIFIVDNYDVKDFIEQLSDYCDLNTDTDSDSEEEKKEKIDIKIDKDGFYSIK
jgi:hypothetical protein